MATSVISNSTYEGVLECEFNASRLKDLYRFGDHLGADAISCQDCDLICHAERLYLKTDSGCPAQPRISSRWINRAPLSCIRLGKVTSPCTSSVKTKSDLIHGTSN